jgi:hypothetical protein
VDEVQPVQVFVAGEASGCGLGVDGAGLVELAAGVAAFAEGLIGQAFDDGADGGGAADAGLGAGDDGAQVVFVPVALFGACQLGGGGDVGVGLQGAAAGDEQEGAFFCGQVVAVFCFASARAAVGGFAFKVQGAGVVRVQHGQGLLGADAAFGLAGDFADALVVAAVEEAGSGAVAIGLG